MGATLSVALAHAVSSAVLRHNHLSVPASFSSVLDSKIRPGRNIVIPYIDDINVVGTSAVKVNRDQLKAAAALDAVNLHTDTKKDFFADEAPYKVWIGLA